MSKLNIYLAGRMDGLSIEEAMNWRYNLKCELMEEFNVLIPLYNTLDNQPHAMWGMDYFLLDKSDILIVNFDYEYDAPFIGTSMEIARAYYQRKPIIIFSSKPWIKDNTTLKHHATFIVDSIDEAIDAAKLFLQN